MKQLLFDRLSEGIGVSSCAGKRACCALCMWARPRFRQQVEIASRSWRWKVDQPAPTWPVSVRPATPWTATTVQPDGARSGSPQAVAVWIQGAGRRQIAGGVGSWVRADHPSRVSGDRARNGGELGRYAQPQPACSSIGFAVQAVLRSLRDRSVLGHWRR